MTRDAKLKCDVGKPRLFLRDADEHGDADDDQTREVHQACSTWARKVSVGKTSQSSKKRKSHPGSKDFKKSFLINCDADVDDVERFVLGMKTSKHTTSGALPPPANDEVWTVADTGSSVTNAKCSEAFPCLEVQPSNGQRTGVQYTAADGGKLDNKGAIGSHSCHRRRDRGAVYFPTH